MNGDAEQSATTPTSTEKSEQRRPDATAVAPGILRIMLPIDLPGLGHVNCYALRDDDGVGLIDPGMADGVTFDVLSERFRDSRRLRIR